MPSFPSVTFNIVAPQQLAGVTDHKVLIVGQQLSGTAVAGELQQNVGTAGQEDALFGARSHVAGLVREFRRINKDTQVDVIGLADAGGAVQATSVVTITGTATEDNTLIINVGSGRQHSYSLDVLTGDTATEVGDALAAAITADTKAPFTAANALGVVTITASNGGTLANSWAIQAVGSVAGISAALTGWTGGATDPTLTTLFDPVANIRYNTVVWPEAWTITTLTGFLDPRFNTTNNVLDGVGIVHKNDTLANLKSFVSPLNSQSVRVGGTKAISTSTLIGGSVVEMDDVLASRMAAVRSLRLTANANVNDILSISGAPLDSFGGISLSTLPYANTLISFTALPNPVHMFTLQEEAELENNGVSTIGLNRAGNALILGQQVTTRLTDTAGNPDTTFKFLNAVDSSSIIREFFFENNKARYAQARLSDGDLVAGRSIQNEASIRAFQKELYVFLSDLAITQRGGPAVKDFDTNLVVTVSVATGSVTINSAPLQVGQLRIVLGAIEVNFGG